MPMAAQAGSTEPPRLVHVIGDGKPGGGTTFVLNLSAAMTAQGFEPIVVTQRDSYLFDRAREAGLLALGLDFTTRRRSVALSLGLKRALMSLEPAVIHVHGTRAGLPVALSGVWRRRPMIYTVHGLHFHHKTGLRRMAGRLAEAVCFKCARETVFVSNGDKGYAAQEGILPHVRRTRVLTNSIPALHAEIRAEAAKPKTCDIAFLGRLERQKNPLIIPDILAALKPLRPTIRVVGGGSLEQALRNKAAAAGVLDQMTFCGALEHRAALREVARARLLLLPSAWEGHPISLIEAMHLGLPVVASALPGIDEVVRNGETGYLVPPTDVESYALRIGSLLGDAALLARMSTAAVETVNTTFSFAEHVRQHVLLYRQHLDAGALQTAQRGRC